MSSKRRYSTAAYATFLIDLWDGLYQARPWASTTGSVAERHHPGQVRQTRTAGSSLCPIVEFSEVYEAPVVLSCSVEYPSKYLTCFVANDATKGPSSHAELVCAHSVESRAQRSTHGHFPA